jgi:hypothetical protein
MENFERLKETSSKFTQMYNSFLASYELEDWEISAIQDAILREKVFDV